MMMPYLFPILLAIYEFGTYLSNDAYLPAMPAMAAELHASTHLVQLTITAWLIGGASTQLFLGAVVDRYGRRTVLLSGGAAFVVTTLFCAMAGNIHLLLVGRVLQGATIPSLLVAGYAAVHEYYDRFKAMQAFALMQGISLLAPAFGPVLGASIAHWAGWRLIFTALAVWAFVVLMVLTLVMPETNTYSTEPQAIKQRLKNYLSLMRQHEFMAMVIVFQMLSASIFAWITASPFLLMARYGLGLMDFALLQGLIFGCFIAANHSVRLVLKAVNPETIVVIGVAVFIASAGSCCLLSILTRYQVIIMIIAMACIATAAGAVFPVLNRLAVEASDGPMGQTVAVLTWLVALANAFSSALVSYMASEHVPVLAAILFVFSLTAGLLLSRQSRRLKAMN